MREVNIDWEPYRRGDGSIDLRKAFSETQTQGDLTEHEWVMLTQYFRIIERRKVIKSRQVAAAALANAEMLIIQFRGRLGWMRPYG